jgi:hypothetical protein
MPFCILCEDPEASSSPWERCICHTGKLTHYVNAGPARDYNDVWRAFANCHALLSSFVRNLGRACALAGLGGLGLMTLGLGPYAPLL